MQFNFGSNYKLQNNINSSEKFCVIQINHLINSRIFNRVLHDGIYFLTCIVFDNKFNTLSQFKALASKDQSITYNFMKIKKPKRRAVPRVASDVMTESSAQA